jgi:hypothetical protein
MAFEHLTVDEIARTSEDAMVRMQFDTRNASWLRFVTIMFGLLGIGQLIGVLATDRNFQPLRDRKPNKLTALLSRTIETKGINAAVAQYRSLREQGFPGLNESESATNSLGYELLGNGEKESAIQIFRLNVEAHPKSANAYDSLGEAYLAAGNKALAIENYQKAVAIDPETRTAVSALQRLTNRARAPDRRLLLWLRTAIALLNLTLTVAMFMAARKRASSWSLIKYLRNHIRPAALTYCLTISVLTLVYFAGTDGMIGCALFIPLLMLGFRMLPAELLLLHGVLFGATFAGAFFAKTPEQDTAPLVVSAVMMNGTALWIETAASRRMRSSTTSDWSGRRRHAQDQLRMRDELRYAREVQLSMLPDADPKLDWVDLAGTSLPASEVGGDYYDYFVAGDRVAIVSGDVAGHGLAAGLVLAALRSGFTLLRDSLGDPAAVLQRLHALVSETTRRRTLVTCAVLLLDRATRRATLASAGHPPVVVRQGDTVQTADLFAPPLGVRLPLRIPHREIAFASNDVFVLHTDGVYESLNGAGETYGIERIEAVVREHGTSSAAAIRDAVIDDVQRFRNGTPQGDDVTVVVAKIL